MTGCGDGSVTFRYKKPFDDGSKPIQYGLIAEEVASEPCASNTEARLRSNRNSELQFRRLTCKLCGAGRKVH